MAPGHCSVHYERAKWFSLSFWSCSQGRNIGASMAYVGQFQSISAFIKHHVKHTESCPGPEAPQPQNETMQYKSSG